jgi:8-amino-7-oxononanoate synthase
MKISLHDFARRRMRLAAAGLPASMSLSGEDSPWFVTIDRMKAKAAAAGRQFQSFAHYDYLGLSEHPEVLDAASAAISTYGVGAGGSRVIGGERSIHQAFEQEIAGFVGTEAALLLNTGYIVSPTLIPHLMGASDLIVMDDLSHSSVISGVKATRATVRTFRHNDLDHLDEILAAEREKHDLCLIAVESLYSMDGDLLDLPRLLDIRNRHSAWALVDEAHSIGVLGATGRGICEHYGIDPNEVDVIVGTMSKTFVSMGGFVCARKAVIDWLKFTLPGFVFSVGLSPVLVAAAHAALMLMQREPERVARLQALSRFFVARAAEAGLNTGDAVGAAIIPIYFDSSEQALSVSARLSEIGIYAPPIIHSGIKDGDARIRFFVTAGMTEERISALVEHVRSFCAKA